ncbi:MAG TPA: quinolinate synthase NadA [Methanomicrobia archaeon]|nr:quinolinate synthase NadA [Methanomicrobia archaeon]
MQIEERIAALKRERNAIILAHNYQIPAVQDIADFVGDSLELARRATATDADMIIFCGVDFMAETAAILNPEKAVILPDLCSICPMAQQLLSEELRSVQRVHPEAETVLYVNTRAESKTLADCICTSANAPAIVRAMDSDVIIFGPDHNLGYYAQKGSTKKLLIVPEYGNCPSHHLISLEELEAAKKAHPSAAIIVHPEVIPEIQERADYVASTSGMVQVAREIANKELLIGTEIGVLHRLKKEVPGKAYYPISTNAVCPQMKMITLPKILTSLEQEKPRIDLPPAIMERARWPIERMLALSP